MISRILAIAAATALTCLVAGHMINALVYAALRGGMMP
jgi:hypothetical protein